MKMTSAKHLLLLTACAALAGMATGCRTRQPAPQKFDSLLSARNIEFPSPRYASEASNASVPQQPVASPVTTPNTKAEDGAFKFENDDTLTLPGTGAGKPETAVQQPLEKKGRTMPIAPANSVMAPKNTAGTSAAAAGEKVYIVKKGDVLSRIASTHHVKKNEIIALNPQLSDPNKLKVGQAVKLPAHATGSDLQNVAAAAQPKTAADKVTAGSKGGKTPIPADGIYTVANNDCLSGIASRFGVKSSDIKAWNNLSSDKLKAGQKLKLRGDAVVTKSAPKAKATKAAATVTAAKATDSIKPSDVKKEDGAADAPANDATAAAPAVNTPAPATPVVDVSPAVTDDVTANGSGTVASDMPPLDTKANKATHTVVAGNTLEELAKVYFTTVDEIRKNNPDVIKPDTKPTDELTPGTKIVIYW